MKREYPLDLERTGEKRESIKYRRVNPLPEPVKRGFNIAQEELEKSLGYVKPIAEKRKDATQKN